jgi:hypothetical protein
MKDLKEKKKSRCLYMLTLLPMSTFAVKHVRQQCTVSNDSKLFPEFCESTSGNTFSRSCD